MTSTSCRLGVRSTATILSAPSSSQHLQKYFPARYHFSGSSVGCPSVIHPVIVAGVTSTATRPAAPGGKDSSRLRHVTDSRQLVCPVSCKLQWNCGNCRIWQHYRSFHTTVGRLSPSRTTRGQLMTTEDARNFVGSLSTYQRECLERAIRDEEEERGTGGGEEKSEGERSERHPPSWHQLRMLSYQQALPFIGFGFLDNFIMITVGEYIDINIGAALTISTMAAAGLGNLISDLAGLGLADRVEALCRMIGIPNPRLSSSQLQHRAARRMGLLGRCLGIGIGCILGMVPLFWFDHSHKTDEGQETKK